MTESVANFEKMKDMFEKHAYDDLQHFGELAATLRRIEEKTDAQSVILSPIANTFQTASTLGRWLMPLLVAVSLIVGIIWGVVQITLHR